MEIRWQVSAQDAKRVRLLVREHRQDKFVRNRFNRNVRRDHLPITKHNVWHMLTMCLLTTQQRSGPNEPVNRLLALRPYPLSYGRVSSHRNPAALVRAELKAYGGIRRGPTIGKQFGANLDAFAGTGWRELRTRLESLPGSRDHRTERLVAEWLAEEVAGLGPKQSRNLLQSLGLTRYETPIDSRIAKWLNEFGFPIRVNAVVLSDRAYYAMVSDGIQALCRAAGVYPCVLDAVVFSLSDGDEWDGVNLRWA